MKVESLDKPELSEMDEVDLAILLDPLDVVPLVDVISSLSEVPDEIEAGEEKSEDCNGDEYFVVEIGSVNVVGADSKVPSVPLEPVLTSKLEVSTEKGCERLGKVNEDVLNESLDKTTEYDWLDGALDGALADAELEESLDKSLNGIPVDFETTLKIADDTDHVDVGKLDDPLETLASNVEINDSLDDVVDGDGTYDELLVYCHAPELMDDGVWMNEEQVDDIPEFEDSPENLLDEALTEALKAVEKELEVGELELKLENSLNDSLDQPLDDGKLELKLEDTLNETLKEALDDGELEPLDDGKLELRLEDPLVEKL